MWINVPILLFILLSRVVTSHDTSRQRRYLLFPPSTQWGVFAAVSIPLHPETTVSVAWFLEANYYNVANATYFEPLLGDITVSRNRDKRGVDAPKDVITRRSLYISIEDMLQRHGYPGEPCLLRAICENVTSHFLHNGLLGDLLHFVLTPSTSMSEDDLDDVYYEAEYCGLYKQCDNYIGHCPVSPLEYITVHVEEYL